jgi:superfamily II DNA helicase RecQ
MVARMLIGSKAKEVAKFKLDKLSTFGLLAHLTESQATAFIDALMAARLIEQYEETAYRPLIRLTPAGEEVMKGSATFTEHLAMPGHVLARLESGRPSPTQERRKADAMAKKRSAAPTSESDSIGSTDPFDAVNAELDEPLEVADEPPPAPRQVVHPSQASEHVHPPHYWTWRVLASGFSADECRQIRQLTAEELREHLLSAAQDGQPVDPRWLLTGAQIKALDNLLRGGSSRDEPDRWRNLPQGVTDQDARLFVLCRDLGNRR